MERLRSHNKGSNWGSGSVARLKFWTFPICWISAPVLILSPDHRQHIGKKVSLIAFRQVLPKVLIVSYIFINTIMTNLKKFIGNKWNKFLNAKQCPALLSPRIIPLNFYGKLWGWRRIPANSQKFTTFPIQKYHPW